MMSDAYSGRSRSLFGYDDAVIEQFSTIRAGVVQATGLTNPPSSRRLLDEYRVEQRAVAEQLRGVSVAELASIAAWRRAFTQFGVKPTQYRGAAEALLRRLTKHGDIPSINTLVDVGNLISIRYALPVAVFDEDGIAGSTTVRFATGNEEFTDLGSTDVIHPEPGEVVFADEDNVVSARRWCWRQSRQTATSSTTTDALIVIEGLHDAAGTDIEGALRDLIALLASRQPEGRVEKYVLSATTPRTGLE